MTQMTITEALAELHTIGARVKKKRESIKMYVGRQEGLKDPLAKTGGSVAYIVRERQSIRDLIKRHIDIRVAIQRSNHAATITIGESTMTVAEWLTWRKEAAPEIKSFLGELRSQVHQIREQAQKKGFGVVSAATAIVSQDAQLTDVNINIDEAELAAEIEGFETVLGTLDGQLSLKNATTYIEVA